jgi:hypothetical protein
MRYGAGLQLKQGHGTINSYMHASLARYPRRSAFGVAVTCTREGGWEDKTESVLRVCDTSLCTRHGVKVPKGMRTLDDDDPENEKVRQGGKRYVA